MAPKPSNPKELRLVIDYRQINEITVKDKYPLPEDVQCLLTREQSPIALRSVSVSPCQLSAGAAAQLIERFWRRATSREPRAQPCQLIAGAAAQLADRATRRAPARLGERHERTPATATAPRGYHGDPSRLPHAGPAETQLEECVRLPHAGPAEAQPEERARLPHAGPAEAQPEERARLPHAGLAEAQPEECARLPHASSPEAASDHAPGHAVNLRGERESEPPHVGRHRGRDMQLLTRRELPRAA
ncbi:hypothetical protein CYMTET_47874 [Cymbomonas tetramitiformis]|uniref:Uncharacterized protein n=1 Tax=Cymbomonas tetramitiformis TaxID=36881 RepID=A0AAE0BUF7_9CHLO|nr:hypothetical protein CYMTET_47874 [Cymbomonas tetramitiformis]